MVRTNRAIKKILFIIILASPLLPAVSQVSLREIVDQTQATFHWDPYQNMGVLQRGERFISFRPEEPLLLIDYNQAVYAPGTARNRSGEIIFSDQALEVIQDILEPSFSPEYAPRIQTIIIDPGHGGKDPGANSTIQQNGETVDVIEKDIVLSVALRLSALLTTSFPETTILLTREDDRFIDLAERSRIANAVELEEDNAALFISIHANAALNNTATGFEVWYLPPGNKADLSDSPSLADADPSLRPFLAEMLEDAYSRESIQLAENILESMDDEIGSDSPNRGLHRGLWSVVRNSKMPSVLIETGFISNPGEAARLLDPNYLQTIAIGIYNGLETFIEDFENSRGFTQ